MCMCVSVREYVCMCAYMSVSECGVCEKVWYTCV